MNNVLPPLNRFVKNRLEHGAKAMQKQRKYKRKKPEGVKQKTTIKSFLNKSYIPGLLLLIGVFLVINIGCSHITHGIASMAATSFPGCLYFVETDEKMLALTIDDGPDPSTTPEILAVLKRYDAKATFFLISSFVADNEDLVAQIVEQGHELGHHMTHDEPSIKLSHDDFVAKFNQAERVLSQFAEIHWFRPGSGWYDAEMITYLAHNECGYRCVLGSVYPLDAVIPSSLFATVFISLNIQPGSIVILHDRENRGRRTVTTLTRILPKLQRRGYKIVTLTELYENIM